jgi:tetratricopeptide (TPR) repeat protein
VGLAISGVLLLAAALAWTWWRKREPQKPQTASESSVILDAKKTSLDPSAGASGVATQPQTEAAVLKREAVAVARQVSEAYPNDGLAYALLGSAYYNTGQSTEAVKYLRKCLELSPGQAEAYDIQARVAYEKGDLEETVRLCREGLKRGPSNPEVLNRLGRALMDLGRTAEAIGTLQQAVALPKPTSESFYLLGQGHLQSGDYAQAKESFRQAIALLPDHTQAFFGLFTACMRLGQTEEAERYRQQFLKLEAIDRRALTDRSAQEDTLTGLPLVRKTVARTFFGAAQIYGVHEDSGKAAELLLKSAMLDADSPVYRSALEAHYIRRKALVEGVSAFEQLVRQQPEGKLNHLFLGRLHARLDHFDAAERAYQKVRELAPDWSEGYRALTELYLRADRKPIEAGALARRVVELEPSGAHYYLLAVACMKNNDRVGALAAMNQAVALSPGEKKYQQFLQQLKEAP